MSRHHIRTDADGDHRGISVVVPTYNERENLAPLVRNCRGALAEHESEVIVVDDDSPDRTWSVARRAFGDENDVRVLRRKDERGLATAVLEGFDHARYGNLAVIDADFQHPPERLPDLASALSHADIAVGSRYLDGGDIENWSRRRQAISYGATTATRALIPDARDLSDPMSGFFGVREELLEGVSLDPTGYKILLEILTKCEAERVVEVPYTFTDRREGESKTSPEEYAKFLNHLTACSVQSHIDDHDWVVGSTPLAAVLRR